MVNILLIETATDICSIGISVDGQLAAIRETSVFNEHGKRINIFIQECLQEAVISISALNAVAISSGPGSFTSLRIGTATAKGLCYALSIPLIAVDTMKALAMAAALNESANTLYIPMIDARSMGVFYAIYDEKGTMLKPLSRGKLNNDTLAPYQNNQQKIVCCGHAAEKFKDNLGKNIAYYPQVINSARLLLPLATEAYKRKLWADMAYYEPNYLAPPNITVSKKKSLGNL